MRIRFPAILAALIVCVGISSLHAQSLSSKQRATLDGRLERIVQKANQGTLEADIRSFSQKDPTPLWTREGERSRTEKTEGGRAAPDPSSALPFLFFRDVRPSTRQADGTPVYEAIVRSTDASVFDAAGITPTSVFDELATVRATPKELGRLSQMTAVDRVHSPRQVQLHNDEAAAEAGVRTLNKGVGGTAYRGQGVMTCVIDSGIDWSHPDFMGPNGNTRIHSIWDHTDDASAPSPEANDASRFGADFTPDYGSEYFAADINDGAVSETDGNGHGTHVAGTVASSGRAHKQSSGTTKYRGMAPNADIIAVKTGFQDTDLINAVNYCGSVASAQGKPVVVNMSLGTTFAPRDGSEPLAAAIDEMTNGGTSSGMVVVASAGNSGSPSTPTHTSGRVAAGDSADATVTVPAYSPNSGDGNDYFATSLWTYEDGPYSLSVYSPGMEDTLTVTTENPSEAVDQFASTPSGAVYVESVPMGEARYFVVEVFDESSDALPAEGTWTLRVRSEGPQATDYHGWFLGSRLGGKQVTYDGANNNYTLGSPATSPGALAVGAYVQRQRWTSADGATVDLKSGRGTTRDHIADFSSRGPTVDGRQKPVVSAAGAYTVSALSDDASPAYGPDYRAADGEHQLIAGTSMSAPVVTGAVALLLQEEAGLTTNQVRSLLAQTARVDDRVQARGGSWNDAFGHGKLDALAALTQLRSGTAEASTTVLAYEDAFGEGAATSVPVGDGAAERLALRFTPSESGALTGTYLSVGQPDESGSANALTDSLYVQVWTDDGTGRPDAPRGQRVAVPAQRLRAFTPNFVGLRETRVAVSAGEDYHLVLTPTNNGGTLDVLAETTDGTAGRSLSFDGSSWTATGNDLSVRAQVGDNLTTDDRTPPLVPRALTATAYADSVVLDWSPPPASGVDQYRIYRDTAPIDSAAGPSGRSVHASVSGSTQHYTDEAVQLSTQYHYRVTAVDESDNESGFSNEATATPRPVPVLAVQPDTVQAVTAPDTQVDAALTLANEGRSSSELTFSFPGFAAEKRLQQVGARRHNDPERQYEHREFKKGAADPRTGTPVTLGAGGPDAAGYRWIDSNEPGGPVFQWTDIRAEGTQLSLLDDDQETVTLPSPVSFYGATRSEVTISSNGYLTFGSSGTAFSNDEIPDPYAPNALIAPFWDDLDPGDAGTVHYLRDTANDRLIVQWTGVAYYSGGGTNTFQVVLDGDGTIQYRYLDMSPQESATVGIENDAGDDGLPVAFNTDYVEDSLAVRIATTPPLVTDVTPASGTIAGGERQDVTVTMTAERRDEGTYEASLSLATNNQARPDTTGVPVALTVDRLSAPSCLTARSDSPHVALEWDAVADPKQDGYHVYRASTPFESVSEAEKVNDTVVSTSTYTDSSVAARTSYFYRVVTVSEQGGTSRASNEALGELPVRAAAREVGSDGTYSFGDTGADVGFGETSGMDSVYVRKFGTGPARRDSIDEANVSTYRYRIARDEDLDFGAMTARFDVSALAGIDDASRVTAYTRAPCTGSFTEQSTLYDAVSGELVVTANSPGDVVFASTSEPLPVELTQFEGRTTDDGVVLRWRTASEQNNAGFRVQRRRMPAGARANPSSARSEAGWTDVGRVEGGGTTTNAQSYRFADADLPYDADSLTYRLKQVDTDGTARTSRAITVARGAVDAVALHDPYPNPARRQMTVQYALPAQQDVTLRLYDVLGRRVRTVVKSQREGRHEVQLDVQDLASGVYFLRLRGRGEVRTQKVTVVR